MGACGFAAPDARIGVADFTAFAAGAETTRAPGLGAAREGCAGLGGFPDLSLAGLAVLEREATAFGLRVVIFAAFRGAGRRGAAFLAIGFLVFEAFFAGISFSAPG